MPSSSHLQFNHEKLIRYQPSIQFVAWPGKLLTELPPKLAVSDQLDRAATSVPLNLGEGNGKYTAPDLSKKKRKRKIVGRLREFHPAPSESHLAN
jgi:23S rRNA-intervening sequence protein